MNSDQLKLTKVVLFKIGIGSFQKKGKINLNDKKSVRLSVAKSVMNDLLKTFSILKTKGDLMVSGVSYEAKDIDRSKLLEDNSINLPNSNSLISLIQQVRGIKLEIKLKQEKVAGWVVGTQDFKEAPTGQAIISEEYILLTTEDNGIKPVKISDILGLKILDADVEKDFQYFLETIISQNKEKNKMITLFFEGDDESEYILNFLQEVPAWKTSYRLFLDENILNESEADEDTKEKSFESDGQIQGWAIIDNVLDEDWDGVDLTLVTGLPISFIYDSYSPAWIKRPKIERKTDLGVQVVQFEKKLEEREEVPIKRKPAPKMAMRTRAAMEPEAAAPPPSPPGGRGFAMMADISTGSLMEDSFDDDEVESTFEAGAEGEGGKGVAFKYHIGTPVHVQRNNSSLIPILQSDLETKLISVYNRSVNIKNPILTIEFTNETDLTLEKGPISIFIEDQFSGEAMLPFLESGDEARLPYAVDQAIKMSYSQDTKSENYHKITISDNAYTHYFYNYIHKYTINNKGTTPRIVIIEHPRYNNRELYKTEKPDEITKNFLRFKIEIQPKKSKVFTVKERMLKKSYYYIANLSSKDIEKWDKEGLLEKTEKAYLLSHLKLSNEKQKLERKMNEIDNTIQSIFSEQERLRENLKAFSGSRSEKEVIERYIEKFDKRETELEQMSEQKKSLSNEIEKIENDLKELDDAWIAEQLKAKKEEA